MSGNIKAIYIGLPESLASELLWVDDSYRINELSHQPGGRDIVIEYANGNVLGYDRIKYPPEYIKQILINELADGNEDAFDNLGEITQLELTKQIINAAYTRKRSDISDTKPAAFEQIWNSKSSRITLVEALQELDNFEVEKSDVITAIKLMISEINRSKSGVGFDATCWEILENIDPDLIGRTVYCRFRTTKHVRSEFYVANNRVEQVTTKSGRKVWVVKYP